MTQQHRTQAETTPGSEADKRHIAAELRRLAAITEQAAPAEQAQCLSSATAPVCAGLAAKGTPLPDAAQELATRHMLSGAWESAILALIPANASVTGGRLADGMVIGQVLLEGQAGRHSRRAQTLALAWLTALLTSLADSLSPQDQDDGK